MEASWKIDQAVADGVDDQFGGFVNAESVHDIGAVDGDSVGAETQVDGDFLIGFSRDDMLQNFQLAGSEAGAAFPFQRRGFGNLRIENGFAERDGFYRADEIEI